MAARSGHGYSDFLRPRQMRATPTATPTAPAATHRGSPVMKLSGAQDTLIPCRTHTAPATAKTQPTTAVTGRTLRRYLDLR